MTGAEYDRARNKARCRQYYQIHYDELREKRIVRQQDPEYKAKQKAWREANREKIRLYNKRWRDNNPEKIAAYHRARYAKMKEAQHGQH